MSARCKQRMLLKQFFIPQSLYESLRNYAEMHEVSVSLVIRCAIQAFVDPLYINPSIQEKLFKCSD